MPGSVIPLALINVNQDGVLVQRATKLLRPTRTAPKAIIGPGLHDASKHRATATHRPRGRSKKKRSKFAIRAWTQADE